MISIDAKDQGNHIDLRLQQSPFFPRIKDLNFSEQWTEWNGYQTPTYFLDAYVEYYATRNTCGVFDVSPMKKYIIEGPDAEAMMNRLTVRDVRKQKVGRVTYTVWCTDEGRIIDDGTLFRLEDNKFMLCAADPNLDWLLLGAIGMDVNVYENTEDYAALALQGPTSCALLKAMGFTGVENAKPFDIVYFDFEGTELMISRTGFTGDLGYELWIDPTKALAFWDKLFSVGYEYGIRAMGDESLNMARIEAGLLAPAVEFNSALHTVEFRHDQTPFELGLDWMVNFKKPAFSGREALLKEKENGPKYKLVKLDFEGQKSAEGSILYSDRKCTKEIGYVTSGMWSSVVKASIGYGFVKAEYADGPMFAEIYYQKELRWYQKVVEGRKQDKPFWWPDRAKMTPPMDT